MDLNENANEMDLFENMDKIDLKENVNEIDLNENKVFKIRLAYLGTRYHGWQKQLNVNTVENELIRACQRIFSEFDIKGASRTDAGVHSVGQVVSIEAYTRLNGERLMCALNSYLPEDIVVQEAHAVDCNFHPRYHAVNKTYVYRIYNAKVPLPQYNETAYFFYKPLDINAMNEACDYFIGEHDFYGFASEGGKVKNFIRTVYSLEINKHNNLIEVSISGNGFLYNMVRIIVGTLIDVGIHKKKPEDIPGIIKSKDRALSGKKAPAIGLTLEKINYNQDS